MVESLQTFHDRVDGFQRDSLPHEYGFSTSAGLEAKVDAWGGLKPYFGNTVIYELDNEVKVALSKRQVLLHHRISECLAVPISPETFHITLHDLISSSDEYVIAKEVKHTGECAKALLEEIKERGIPPIRMVSTHVFSMVNTSIVMGFAPEREKDCGTLMALYERFHAVKPLSWGLTPHVTLAYYKPGYYNQEWTKRINGVFHEAESMPPVRITLSPEALFYRTFRDMNTYL
ncbi:MAG: hypothetical protein IKT57_06305 [Clostridia bacterium]|nr:hypothetical protein [Clostridia bacterium]